VAGVRKTSSLKLPDSRQELLASLAAALTHDVRRAVVDLDREVVSVDWVDRFDGEDVFAETDAEVGVAEIVNSADQLELDVPELVIRPHALAALAHSLQMLSVSRLHAATWVCKNADRLRTWLGLSRIVPLTGGLLGIPLLVYPDLRGSEDVLLLFGVRLSGSPLTATKEIRVITMREEVST